MPRRGKLRPGRSTKQPSKKRGSSVSHQKPLLDDNHPIFSKLKGLGRPVIDEDSFHGASKMMYEILHENQLIIEFALTSEEKAAAFSSWNEQKIRHACRLKQMEGQLEPLMWEESTMQTLILYEDADEMFWSWNDVEGLKEVGHYWTDLFYPSFWL